jgi:hypothetical protein
MAMRKLLGALVLGAALAVGGAPTATAAPSDIQLTMGSKAQFVSPSTILVPVTVTCPTTFVFASVGVTVAQESTGGTGGGGATVFCTGSAVTAVVPVSGGPYTLGPALGRAFAQSGTEVVVVTRRIQITL